MLPLPAMHVNAIGFASHRAWGKGFASPALIGYAIKLLAGGKQGHYLPSTQLS